MEWGDRERERERAARLFKSRDWLSRLSKSVGESGCFYGWL